VYIHTLRVSNSPPGIRAAATPHTPPPSPITTFDPCGLVSSRPAGWKSLQHVPYISMYPTSACTLHTLGSPATIAGRWGGAHQGVLARGESELGSSSSQRPADQLHGSCDASDFSAGRDAAATTTNRPTERLKGKSNASRGGGGGGVRCIYSGALVWRCTYVRDHFFVFSSIYDFPHLPCKPGTVSLPPPAQCCRASHGARGLSLRPSLADETQLALRTSVPELELNGYIHRVCTYTAERIFFCVCFCLVKLAYVEYSLSLLSYL